MNCFIYMDNEFKLDQENLFLSNTYESKEDFLKKNKMDNYRPLITYNVEVVLEGWFADKKTRKIAKEILKHYKDSK